MAFRFSYIWYAVNERKIAEHRITKEEYEHVLETTSKAMWDRSRSSGEFIAFGFTQTRRFIACVFHLVDDDTILPITAYDVEP